MLHALDAITSDDLRDLRAAEAEDTPGLAAVPTAAMREIWGRADEEVLQSHARVFALPPLFGCRCFSVLLLFGAAARLCRYMTRHARWLGCIPSVPSASGRLRVGMT